MSFDLKISKGSIFINKDGTLGTVSGNEKLKQDIIKIILTDLGENKYHPYYGSKIGSLEIGEVLNQEILELDMISSIEQALEKLISLQKQQAKKQYLSSSEVLLKVLDVSAGRDELDPRLYNVFISVLTEKLDIITENVTVRIS